jgi:negative regulator of replication initiation
MSEAALRTRDQIAADCLQQMQELAREISASMDAIASNAMPGFQESVARQEMLCSSLAAMANTIGEGSRPSVQTLLPGIDATLESRIRAASKALCELNLQYAALLRHSGKFIAVLATLYRSQTGQFQEAHGSRLKYHTWSCEM